MLTIYGIPNCNSVKKTFDYLKAKNIAYEFHNYKKDGISVEKLVEWFGQIPLSTLVNKKGTTYKGLDENSKISLEKQQTAIDVIMAHPSVIKRPIIEDKRVLAVGFDEQVLDGLFG